MECPDCKVPMEPSPLSPDPTALVCSRCGLDRLGAIMLEIAAGHMVWDYRDADVVLRWRNGERPDPQELAALKRLIPSWRRVPLAHLAQAIGVGATWLIATARTPEARALYVRARELCLVAEIVYHPETRGTSAEHEEEDADDAEYKES